MNAERSVFIRGPVLSLSGAASYGAGMRMLIGGLLLVPVLLGSPAHARCTGDCNGDAAVTVDELMRGVALALEVPATPACAGFAPPVRVDALLAAVGHALDDDCPGRTLPALVASEPADAAAAVPVSAWLRLTFAAPPAADAVARLGLQCDGADIALRATTIAPAAIVLDPLAAGQLPPATACTLRFGTAPLLAFTTAAAGAPATVLHDRADARRLVPFPDDFFTVADPETATGRRVAVPLPAGPADLQQIFGGLLPRTNALDGFSPLAHWVIELSDAPDPATLPRTPAESLDPLASIALYDVTSGAPTYGRRTPFRLEPRTDTSVDGVTTHSLLLFPSVPLEPTHRYGLIVTRRVLADATRPFAPAAPFAQCLEPASVPTPDAERCAAVRELAQRAVPAPPAAGEPVIDLADVALALHVTVRSTGGIAADQVAVGRQVRAAPPPAWAITSVEPGTSGAVAAIVRGTWQAPDWRDGLFFARDAAGAPRPTRVRAVPFTLALPTAALAGPVPIVMYQHGNPGSAENEVPSAARRSLAAEGFAVIGFTDILNRELSAGIDDRDQAILAQVAPVLQSILMQARIPDYWAETRAEQLAFVRLLDGLGTMDVLPLGAPDGVPDLDPAAPRMYLGISEGANNGPGILPYAPEIRAAALVAGGARLAEVLIHQAAPLFLNTLGAIFRSLTPTEIWLGLSLFQHLFDDQDAHNHARFLYRQPVDAGPDARRASVLVIEGLDDSLVPNHATDSAAWAFGPLPHLAPVQRAVPFLDVVAGPLQGNVFPDTTAAFYQYVPTGIPGIDPTPGCVTLPPSSGSEGHFCPQSAPESFHQRAVFFRSALEGTPLIIDPLAQPVPAMDAPMPAGELVW